MVLDYASLAKTIMTYRNMLNGFDHTGNSTNDFNQLKFLRYYLVLYYASISPLFHREARIEDDADWEPVSKRSFGLGVLKKAAKHLQLDFDRTRIAPMIFLDGVKRGEIEVFTANDNYRYFVITEKGKALCDDILKEVDVLGLRMQFITDIQSSNRLAKYFRSYDF